jgi:hypothetical protein
MTVDFESWLQQGYEAGFCGPPVCASHDGIPTTGDEDADYEDGGDPCQHVIRLYEDADVKAAVEANHSPSRWRASNRGLAEQAN